MYTDVVVLSGLAVVVLIGGFMGGFYYFIYKDATKSKEKS